MVELRTDRLEDETYYYLEQSVREGKKVFKKRKYLGKELPKDIEKIKEDYIYELFRSQFLDKLEDIKKRNLLHKKRLPQSSKEKEIESFAIKFTYDTQRIEGSTLTLRETANLLQKKLSPKSKPLDDSLEAQAHKSVFLEILKEKRDLSLQMVLRWHRNHFLQTKKDIAGKIRTHQVAIGGSKFMPPSPVEMDPALEEFFLWYKKAKDNFHPVELAGLVNLKFVTIHPFSDGNGRISRLMMNFILSRADYPLFSIPYVGRDAYYNALERSQTNQDDIIFLRWFVKMYVKEVKKFLK